MGLKLVPNGLLFDESGTLVAKREGGFNVASQSSLKMIEELLAMPKKSPGMPVRSATQTELEALIKIHPNDAIAHWDIAKLLVKTNPTKAKSHLKRSIALMPKLAGPRITLGSLLLSEGKKEEAIKELKEAVYLDPKNYVVRKQIWLIENPEKFHPTIDWGWQAQQMQIETKEETERRKKESGG